MNLLALIRCFVEGLDRSLTAILDASAAGLAVEGSATLPDWTPVDAADGPAAPNPPGVAGQPQACRHVMCGEYGSGYCLDPDGMTVDFRTGHHYHP